MFVSIKFSLEYVTLLLSYENANHTKGNGKRKYIHYTDGGRKATLVEVSWKAPGNEASL